MEERAKYTAVLLRRATGLVPVLRARAAHTEELRRIPDETVRDILSSSLYQIMIPKLFGGTDVDYGLSLEAAIGLNKTVYQRGS